MYDSMVILGIETTGPLASVALVDEETLVMQHINQTQYSHLEELVPMIQSILVQSGVTQNDVEAIAVSRGPGSFTGVRIGMVTAKAIAQVWEKPIIEVPTLTSFAFWPKIEPGRICCPLFDARREQVYAAAFRSSDQEYPDNIIEEGAFEVASFLNRLSEKMEKQETVVFYGDGIAACESSIAAWKGPYEVAPENLRFQTADRIALLGRFMYRQGISVDAFSAKPEYLRQSEAERKLMTK